MAKHNEWGQFGEFIGAHYLEKKGYKLWFQNWRFSRQEIDCIAIKENTLHFIEIKTRTSDRFGHPEAAVTPKKLQQIFRAARQFMVQYPGWKKVQYDILAISVKAPYVDFLLFEDVSA